MKSVFPAARFAWPLFLFSVVVSLHVRASTDSVEDGEAYCFNAGVENSWDCDLTEQEDTSIRFEYHTLKVVLKDPNDGAVLDEVLPIERIGEVPLPGGETVVFLGRFRDSMKAFRVVQKCQKAHASQCSQFAPEVVRIGSRGKPEEGRKN